MVLIGDTIFIILLHLKSPLKSLRQCLQLLHALLTLNILNVSNQLQNLILLLLHAEFFLFLLNSRVHASHLIIYALSEV